MTKEDAVAHIDEYGYAVLKGALTADQANALRDRSAELDRRRSGRPAGSTSTSTATRSECGTWSTRVAFTRR